MQHLLRGVAAAEEARAYPSDESTQLLHQLAWFPAAPGSYSSAESWGGLGGDDPDWVQLQRGMSARRGGGEELEREAVARGKAESYGQESGDTKIEGVAGQVAGVGAAGDMAGDGMTQDLDGVAHDEREQAEAGWERVWLSEVVEGAEGGVQVWRVRRSVFDSNDCFLPPARGCVCLSLSPSLSISRTLSVFVSVGMGLCLPVTHTHALPLNRQRETS